ncbi:MAG: chorismate synthase [Crocinitomicaceae bacterium]|nr:chorismate synthase [Crocinitomicaceae bacterium]|tara:strand:- start:1063 stop:2157 length:1095 start_codon:yes stop_codon:yes gene_type:complete
MAGNSFGKHFKLMTFGESHGDSIGGIIDGLPAGLVVDLERIQEDLSRRRPGSSSITTPRKESDNVKFLSGLIEKNGETITLGTPIGFQIANSDKKSSDYTHLEDTYRPSHADYTYSSKYGIRDHRGGGRASARETASRVVGGAFCKELIKSTSSTEISAYVERVHDISIPSAPKFYSRSEVDASIVRCPIPEVSNRMEQRINNIKEEGDSVGGAIVVVARNVEVGLGEPVFDKLNSDLAGALMSIPAAKAIEIGSGLSGTLQKGSEHNDNFHTVGGEIKTETNRSGGIQGGISNGEDIVIRVAFKPTSTIMKSQTSVDLDGNSIILDGVGRHDPCVLPRAVPIVEAMVAMVLADHHLRNKTAKL